VAASAASAVLVSWRAGAGFAVGAALGWLNFYWLDSGVGAIVSAALAQQGVPQPQVPRRVYYGFAGRYALIGVAAYGTVKFLHTPVLAVFGGLFCLAAAAIAESLYEVFTGSI
jgi:ATP synthase I chain